MKATIVTVTPYQQNCSIIKCEQSGKGAIVDPGGDTDKILKAVDQMQVDVEKILLTHGHVDHSAAADPLRRQLEVPIEGPHEADRFWLDKLPEWTKMSGFPPADPFEPDRWLVAGDTVTVGAESLDVYFCPGHSPGHVIFVHPGQRVAWVGDVIFQGSVGRTDLPMCSHEDLMSSIHDTILPLGDDLTFIPGHGPVSTVAQERKTNPFVLDARYGLG
ncbi:MAG: MBL fold metallo-hydrolase [Pseudomonadota bacterium]